MNTSFAKINPAIHWVGRNPEMFPRAIPRRRVGDHGLFYVLAGQGRALIADEWFEIGAGDLLYIPPLTLHEIRDGDDLLSYFWIHFGLDNTPGLPLFEKVLVGIDVMDLNPLLIENPVTFPDVSLFPLRRCGDARHPRDLVQAIVANARRDYDADQGDPISALLAKACLQELLATYVAAPAHPEKALSHPHARRLRWIVAEAEHQMGHRAMSVGEMAQRSGLSLRQFYRSCEEIFGMTPHQILDSLRLRKARLMLHTDYPTLSIGQIAQQCGFDDRLYFSRWFHKQEGTSPKQYALRR